jgi:signal transduction histidine kinase
MRRIAMFLTLCSLIFMLTNANAVDEKAISKNVDAIVAGIESGQAPTVFKADAFEPYAFIMQEDGTMLVHPSLTGENLMDKALPVYQALMKANPDGVWVEYEWKGKMKHTYARKTKSNLIVGSGY